MNALGIAPIGQQGRPVSRRSSQRRWLLGTSAFGAALFASSGAMAQGGGGGTACTNDPIFGPVASLAAAGVTSVASSIGNVNTAFLAQQGSALVASPTSEQPNQQVGGAWIRGVGGEVTVKSRSESTGSATAPALGFEQPGNVSCKNRERETYSGVQLGADIARLNLGGWNLHLGTTAGYLESRGRDGSGSFGTSFQVPFVGSYVVATRGNFFADVMVKREFYNMKINSPDLNLFSQPLSAHGISVTASTGYYINLPNNWFIEPSASFIWSKTKVDPLNVVGVAVPPLSGATSGTLSIQDIESRIGRASVRAGTSFTSGSMILQPFAVASVFHEFAGNITANLQSCANCVTFVGFPVDFNATTTATRVGTYGQFSLGMASQVVNSGWLGFVRADYRTGSNIEGWAGNAGLRYSFMPEAPLAPAPRGKVITKAPPMLVAQPVNWTGLYLGGFLGAAHGRAHIGFVGDVASDPYVAGFIGGGQVGYNMQVNQWVLGVEGDVGGTNLRGARRCGSTFDGFAAPAFTPFFLTCSGSADWVATLAGRIGLAWDRALLYGKGGVAWTEEKFTTNCIAGPQNGIVRTCLNQAGAFTDGFSATTDRVGYVVGFGSEFALSPAWSAKAEYTYTSFGRRSVTASDGGALNVGLNLNAVKVGLNYHLNSLVR